MSFIWSLISYCLSVYKWAILLFRQVKAIKGAVLSLVESEVSKIPEVFLVNKWVEIRIGKETRIISRNTTAFIVRGIRLVTLAVIATKIAGEVIILVVTLYLKLSRIIVLSYDSISKLINVANYFLVLS